MLCLSSPTASSESLLCSPGSESCFVGLRMGFGMVSLLLAGIALFVVFSSFSGVSGGIAVIVSGGESKVTCRAG